MRGPKHPNIVLIVLDTHRWDRLSLYGYQRDTTPNIDDFARQATVFDNGISAAQWTTPSHTSLFTGEYPTTHQMLQVHDALDERFETLAGLLRANGYQTTGFCNNPLLGVLNNGLKRGFNTFYNYCGAVPSVPHQSTRLPRPLNHLWEAYTQQLRKLSYPLQNAFAHSDWLFKMSLHPKFVSFWSKVGNFKGHTANSIRDVKQFLEHKAKDSAPHFVFLNLMETHTPYAPPDTFIAKFAPYFKESREARALIRRHNTAAYRWLLPIDETLAEFEATVLSDMYDVEVHYQDHLLGPLLEYLHQAEDTLTIIVADHGEGLGEHHFMGHSFVPYQELSHVPLIIKFPDQLARSKRVLENVSTRRIFHTILAAAEIQLPETNYRPAVDVNQLSLLQTIRGRDPEGGLVFTEAYPPSTILTVLKKHAPQAIAKFHCTLNRWAAYERPYKLVRIEGIRDELYNLETDATETQNIIDQHPEIVTKLAHNFKNFITQAIARQPDTWSVATVNIDNDENILNHLRALGYIE